MGYTIVSGNTLISSPTTMYIKIMQMYLSKRFNKMPNICSKSQYGIMPKTKWEGAEDPTINNFFKLESITFWICSLKCRSTEANRLSLPQMPDVGTENLQLEMCTWWPFCVCKTYCQWVMLPLRIGGNDMNLKCIAWKLTKYYLGIPPPQCPPRECFLQLWEIVSAQRACLSGEYVDMLIS